jgi:hypothetical protein
MSKASKRSLRMGCGEALGWRSRFNGRLGRKTTVSRQGGAGSPQRGEPGGHRRGR